MSAARAPKKIQKSGHDEVDDLLSAHTTYITDRGTDPAQDPSSMTDYRSELPLMRKLVEITTESMKALRDRENGLVMDLWEKRQYAVDTEATINDQRDEFATDEARQSDILESRRDIALQ